MVKQGLRERGKARRSEAVIRAAFELFAEQGYDATTVAEIDGNASWDWCAISKDALIDVLTRTTAPGPFKSAMTYSLCPSLFSTRMNLPASPLANHVLESFGEVEARS